MGPHSLAKGSAAPRFVVQAASVMCLALGTAVLIIGAPLSAKFSPEHAFVLFEVSERVFVAQEAFLRIFGWLACGAELGKKGALVCDDLARPCQSRGRYDQKGITSRHRGTPARVRKNPASSRGAANATNRQASAGQSRPSCAVLDCRRPRAGIVEYPRRPRRLKYAAASGLVIAGQKIALSCHPRRTRDERPRAASRRAFHRGRN
jgi:hypothetical protein